MENILHKRSYNGKYLSLLIEIVVIMEKITLIYCCKIVLMFYNVKMYGKLREIKIKFNKNERT